MDRPHPTRLPASLQRLRRAAARFVSSARLILALCWVCGVLAALPAWAGNPKAVEAMAKQAGKAFEEADYAKAARLYLGALAQRVPGRCVVASGR